MHSSVRHATMCPPMFTRSWDGRVYEVPSLLRLLVGGGGYARVRASRAWLAHELFARVPVSLSRRLEMWRRGFFAESAVLYDLPRNDPRDYLDDFQYYRMIGRVNDWDGLYDHKLGLRAFLLAMGLRQAATVAYVTDGRILAEPFTPRARLITAEECRKLLSRPGARYVVKPEDGRRGEGVFLMECREEGMLRQRGRIVQPLDLDAFLASRGAALEGTLFEQWIEQGEFWRALYPGSANSIRVLTLWHPDEAEPFIARAVQRIGTAETVPTDNWSGGGISAPVDVTTGRLGPGRMHPLKVTGGTVRFTHHPDTGAQIEGAVLPGWDRGAAAVLRAAGGLPFNRMAGWDLMMDSEGEPVILEANANPDVNLLQVHGGLLTDPRVRRFYLAYGAV